MLYVHSQDFLQKFAAYNSVNFKRENHQMWYIEYTLSTSVMNQIVPCGFVAIEMRDRATPLTFQVCAAALFFDLQAKW